MPNHIKNKNKKHYFLKTERAILHIKHFERKVNARGEIE